MTERGIHYQRRTRFPDGTLVEEDLRAAERPVPLLSAGPVVRGAGLRFVSGFLSAFVWTFWGLLGTLAAILLWRAVS